ncbi:MAG: succinylglutamate-semialdehyde dehydrogenase [Pontixanthobacter sp.]
MMRKIETAMIAPGEPFVSNNPATGSVLWEGIAATVAQCQNTVNAARTAQREWGTASLDHRRTVLNRYAAALKNRSEVLAEDISRENGKPLWEARAEVGAMIAKVGLSISAQEERAGEKSTQAAFGTIELHHRPHGVLAVLGPFNFPGHLPNGHIVPALLAGNAVVFKPSEKTPLVGEHFKAAFEEAGLSPGVFSIVQGGRGTGEALIDQDIDGLLFTGSSGAAGTLRTRLSARPHVLLALELGGNNPLVAWDGDAEGVAAIIAESAYVSSGQRCSCARRLILPEGHWGNRVVEQVADLAGRLSIGPYDANPEPFMGPLIDDAAASAALADQDRIVGAGGQMIVPLTRVEGSSAAFLSPGLIDVTGLDVSDEEIFAPFLQITCVDGWKAALRAANATCFGLAATLIGEDDDLWHEFRGAIRAGVVNRNRPTTGASGALPFGGIGESGNHRPSAWYAADYCEYPVSVQQSPQVHSEAGLLRFKAEYPKG